MSCLRIQDLYRRSTRDGLSQCWHWQGAKRADGQPSIWTVDHARGEKRVQTGPRAVWQIAHGRAPVGLAYRICGCRGCVNPAHMRETAERSDMISASHIAGAYRTDKAQVARLRNIAKARDVAGIVKKPDELVHAVLQADPKEYGRSIARRLGVSEQFVSKVRRGLRAAEAVGAAA